MISLPDVSSQFMPEVISPQVLASKLLTRTLGRTIGLLLGAAWPSMPLACLAATVGANERVQSAAPRVLVLALQDDPFILGPGDQLDLKFYDVPDLSTKLAVLSDGTVSLPLVGNVRVQGLTLSQAEPWCSTLFRKQLQRPQLQHSLAQLRPIRVVLVSEVERPGIYSL